MAKNNHSIGNAGEFYVLAQLAQRGYITGKRSTGALKNHITTRTDLCRVPYGRSYERLKRRSIMVASVNGDEFLKDQTGDRRFWVVDVGQHVIDTPKAEPRSGSHLEGCYRPIQGGEASLLAAG
jgi:hypothetical protein